MPKFNARSWLPVPLLSGALTPGMRSSTSRVLAAPWAWNCSRRTTSRAPGCSKTSAALASASQSPTTVSAGRLAGSSTGSASRV